MIKELLVKSGKLIAWLWPFAALLAVALGTWCVLKTWCSELLGEQDFGRGEGLQVAGIIYAAIGGFVAVMIPIHYSISLDILGKLKTAKDRGRKGTPEESQGECERKLLHYCHTAEVIIFCFGMFGVSVLSQETFVVTSLLDIEASLWYRRVAAVVYGLLVASGVAFNLSLRGEWHVKWSSFRFLHLVYVGGVVLGLLYCGIWVGLLWASECDSLNAVFALGLVTTYYLLWLLLRLFHAPMTAVRGALGV